MSTYTLYVNKSGPVQDVSVHAAATERLLMSLQAPGRRVVTDVVDFPSQDSPKTIVRAQHFTPSPIKADRLSRPNVLNWLKRHPKRFDSPPLLRDMQPFPAHKNLHASFEQFLPELVAGARSQAAVEKKKLETTTIIPSMHVSPPSEPPGPPEPMLPPAKRQRMSNTSNAAADEALRAGYELGKCMLAHRIPHPQTTPPPPNPLPPPSTVPLPPSKIRHQFSKPDFSPSARGFWFIPVTTPPASTDRKHSSAATWDTDAPATTPASLIWTPDRLKALWKALCKLAKDGLLGAVSAECVYEEEVGDEGDHVRVWCDAKVALKVRALMDCFTVRKDGYWFRGCRLIWFDEQGRAVLAA